MISSRGRAFVSVILVRLTYSVIFLAGMAAAGRAQPQVVGPPPGSVALFVTVTDREGHFVTGLTKDNFTVLDGKTARDLTFFGELDVPSSVGVLFDMSGSMTSMDKATLDALNTTALRFMQQSHPASQFYLAEFSDTLRPLTDWTNSTTVILAAIGRVGTRPASKSKRAGGPTALYDACAAALEVVVRGPHRKQAIVIFTDGMDNRSKTSFRDLRRKLQASGVLLYTISAYAREWPSDLNVEGQTILDELASVTGGKAFFTTTRQELYTVAARIAVELRHQYFIAFTPGSVKDVNKWQSVKIKVTPPATLKRSIYARSRGGYFPPLDKP